MWILVPWPGLVFKRDGPNSGQPPLPRNLPDDSV